MGRTGRAPSACPRARPGRGSRSGTAASSAASLRATRRGNRCWRLRTGGSLHIRLCDRRQLLGSQWNRVPYPIEVERHSWSSLTGCPGSGRWIERLAIDRDGRRLVGHNRCRHRGASRSQLRLILATASDEQPYNQQKISHDQRPQTERPHLRIPRRAVATTICSCQSHSIFCCSRQWLARRYRSSSGSGSSSFGCSAL